MFISKIHALDCGQGHNIIESKFHIHIFLSLAVLKFIKMTMLVIMIGENDQISLFSVSRICAVCVTLYLADR